MDLIQNYNEIRVGTPHEKYRHLFGGLHFGGKRLADHFYGGLAMATFLKGDVQGVECEPLWFEWDFKLLE